MSERTGQSPTIDGAPAIADQRISTLIGDRLCIKCGYNLVGQPILREHHYDMLIVRCPECATVASVQEYPVLGRWANRWAAVLAAVWLLVIIALWVGSSAAIFGFTVGSAEMACDSYADYISDLFSQWQVQQQQASTPGAPAAPAAATTGTTITTPSGTVIVARYNTTDFTTWWKGLDHRALLADAGGLFSGLNWLVWYMWMWLAIVGLVFGVMWATILIARGRRGLLLWGAIIILTAAVIGLIPTMEWLSRPPSWTHQAAASQIGPLMMALTLLWGGFWLCVGLMFGRPISRGLIRLLLPPRMRSTLAFLWLTDGLEPPTANARTPKR